MEQRQFPYWKWAGLRWLVLGAGGGVSLWQAARAGHPPSAAPVHGGRGFLSKTKAKRVPRLLIRKHEIVQ